MADIYSIYNRRQLKIPKEKYLALCGNNKIQEFLKHSGIDINYDYKVDIDISNNYVLVFQVENCYYSGPPLPKKIKNRPETFEFDDYDIPIKEYYETKPIIPYSVEAVQKYLENQKQEEQNKLEFFTEERGIEI